ncbi:MAG: amidohydrolase family protein, partial [Syntrophales bacterium]|nr:amidohydrolase family protein [Syntrophales bacterium]
KSPAEELKPVFSRLTKSGLIGFNALVFTEFPTEIKTALKMVPGLYHDSISLAALEMTRDPFPYFELAKPLKVIPFVDARFIDNGIEEKMERLKQGGFKGLKLLYIPEEDRAIRVEGMEQDFGRPLKKSEEITARLIDSASSQGMCVLLHVDLRRYGDFVKEMIRSHPKTNFNIPHFGSSRKAMSHLLETCPNCYTDTSSLGPFIMEDPVSYKSFILQYQDRILYGSDALISNSENVESTLKFVDQFLDDQEIFHKLTCKNYLAFHGMSGF